MIKDLRPSVQGVIPAEGAVRLLECSIGGNLILLPLVEI